jgi:alpha-galactosidase
MTFSVDNLPTGLSVDAATGRITGVLTDKGEFAVSLHAKNDRGEAEKKFRIIIGDRIALTPPMGWSSWNCWGDSIDQDKILRAAKAMNSTGLSQHGFTFINMDDGWQGKRTGTDHALQGNEKFPDMAGLVKGIHDLGLKVGIYSTPWETSYAKYPGGSAQTA